MLGAKPLSSCAAWAGWVGVPVGAGLGSSVFSFCCGKLLDPEFSITLVDGSVTGSGTISLVYAVALPQGIASPCTSKQQSCYLPSHRSLLSLEIASTPAKQRHQGKRRVQPLP